MAVKYLILIKKLQLIMSSVASVTFDRGLSTHVAKSEKSNGREKERQEEEPNWPSFGATLVLSCTAA